MSSLTWKRRTAWTFQVWFKVASMQGKTAPIWRVFGGERDHYRQKSRFCERKVAKKPGMSPETTLLKCMRSSWQFPLKLQSVQPLDSSHSTSSGSFDRIAVSPARAKPENTRWSPGIFATWTPWNTISSTLR